MSYWKWLFLSAKKAAMSKTGKVWLATYIPLLVWVAWVELKPALLGILLWLAGWCMYISYEYYKETT